MAKKNIDTKSFTKFYDDWWIERKNEHAKLRNLDPTTQFRDKKSIDYKFGVAKKLKSFFKQKNPKLLDIACGNGEFLIEAQKVGFDVVGIDISRNAIEQAEQVIKKFVKVGSSEKLPYKSNSFDCITCHGSLEHFLDQERSVKEIARVLKPNGICYIIVPNLMFVGHVYMAWRYGEMPNEAGQPENAMTLLGWKQLLKDNGLKIFKIEKYNEAFGSRRVSFLVTLIWQIVIKYFVPNNMSYCLIFYCKPNK